MKRLSRRGLFWRAAATGALAATGLTIDPTPTRAAARRQAKRLVYTDPFEAKSLGDFGAGFMFQREGIAEGLVWVNFEGKFEPLLATSWEQLSPTQWRFQLRRGVTFQNGAPLTVEDCRFSLSRLAGLPEAARAIQGATVTIEADDWLRIETAAPAPHLLAILADSQAVIFHRDAYDANGELTTPIGTGPYRLQEFRPGDRRVLLAYSSYWQGAPKIDQIDAVMAPLGPTRANMIRSGDADIARIINPVDAVTLRTNPSVELNQVMLPRFRGIYPNCAQGPTSDRRVRQALAHAVDREAITALVLEGEPSAQATLFRPTDPWADPTFKGLPFDLDRARSLLTDAGYGPANPLSLRLDTFAARPELPAMAQVLQQQWAAIGVELTIQLQEYAVLEARALKGEHDLVLSSRNPFFLFDPQLFFESDYLSTGPSNLARYVGADDDIKAMTTLIDASARHDQTRLIERRLIGEDVATIVIAANLQIDAVRRGVTGYQSHPTDIVALTHWLDKA